MQATRIIAIRHGETDWNRASRMQGHLDVPLNAHGQWQARQTARALAGESVAAVYSSDLQRASATARAIAQACGAPLVLEPGLRERNLGRFQGWTFAQVQAQFPEEAAQLAAGQRRHQPPALHARGPDPHRLGRYFPL